MPYVHVEFSDFDTGDMIEELESRGLKVVDNSDSGACSEKMIDEIYNLYRDYANGYNFEQNLKKFFEENLNIIVA